MPTPTDGSDPVARSRAFIGQPNLWPMWPMLPLVRRDSRIGDKDQCGFLIENPLHPWRVYVGTIYQVREIEQLATHDYNTLDQLLAEYIVD